MLYGYLKTSNYCDYDTAAKWKEHITGLAEQGGCPGNIVRQIFIDML